MYRASTPVSFKVCGGKMKQPLLVALRVGGEGMEQAPLLALAVGDGGMEEALLPALRVLSRWWRMLSCLFLE